MKYDPIEELNKEVERGVALPLLMAPILTISCFVGIGLAYANGPAIDAFANRHPFLVVGILVALCAFGLWRIFKMIAW